MSFWRSVIRPRWKGKEGRKWLDGAAARRRYGGGFVRACVAVLLVVAAWAMPVQAGFIPVSSTFDNSADGVDGWSTDGDAGPLTRNSGGYIQATDQHGGQTWYFDAAPKFLGDDSAAYGKYLTFDLRQSTPNNQFGLSSVPDVVLAGGGHTITFNNGGSPASTTFTSYSIQLSDAGGWKDASTGLDASPTEIQQVLGSLTSLRIRAEYSSDTDTDSLDNVVLGADAAAVPAPPTLLLAVSGMALFGGWLRRRRRMNGVAAV